MCTCLYSWKDSSDISTYSFAINEPLIATSFIMPNEKRRRLSSKKKLQRVGKPALGPTLRFVLESFMR